MRVTAVQVRHVVTTLGSESTYTPSAIVMHMRETRDERVVASKAGLVLADGVGHGFGHAWAISMV